jgi:membrane protein implicated in regulation of membrane protease activity
MVLLEGMTLGWFLIILGALLLLVEVHSPGFFAAVPATILIIFGILVLVGLDIFTYPWGIIIAVIVAIVASCVTVTVYSRMTPNKVPTTISRDSLVGKEGRVTKEIDPDSIRGKVIIGTTEWSARSAGPRIPPGAKVRIVSSQGVHIVVEEVV